MKWLTHFLLGSFDRLQQYNLLLFFFFLRLNLCCKSQETIHKLGAIWGSRPSVPFRGLLPLWSKNIFSIVGPKVSGSLFSVDRFRLRIFHLLHDIAKVLPTHRYGNVNLFGVFSPQGSPQGSFLLGQVFPLTAENSSYFFFLGAINHSDGCVCLSMWSDKLSHQYLSPVIGHGRPPQGHG